jgi:hypothetical protein
LPDLRHPWSTGFEDGRLMPMVGNGHRASMEITMGNVRREDLSAEEFASLKEVGGGLSRNGISDEHRKRLIELRLAKEEDGILRQTPHGIFLVRSDVDALAGVRWGRRDR